MWKNYLYLALALFILTACDSDKPSSKPAVLVDTDKSVQRGEGLMSEAEATAMAVQTAIKEGLSSGKSFKEAIPGYQFGMQAEDIKKAHKKLARKGKVERFKSGKSRKEGAYAYRLPVAGEALPIIFDFEYSEEAGLYAGKGLIRLEEEQNSTDVLNVTADLFNKWYGQPSFELPVHNYCKRYLWVEGNRLVDLACELDGVQVRFYNLEEGMPNLFDEKGKTPEKQKEEMELQLEEESTPLTQ